MNYNRAFRQDGWILDNQHVINICRKKWAKKAEIDLDEGGEKVQSSQKFDLIN